MNYLKATHATLLALLLLGSAVRGQSSVLDKPITETFAKATMLQVINDLGNDFDIPIGLERAYDYQEKMVKRMSLVDGQIVWKESNINIQPGTLRSVLDSLVSQDTQYKWELCDGVINIYPVESRDEILGRLLDLKIKKFAPQSTVDKFKIRDSITALPEVLNFLQDHKISPLNRFYPYRRGLRRVDTADLAMSDASLRQILNRVIRESEHKVWVLDRTGYDKNSLELGF